MCFVSEVISRRIWWHLGHLNQMAWQMDWCCFKLSLRLNVFPQSTHSCFTPSWWCLEFICLWRSPFLVNILPHISQACLGNHVDTVEAHRQLNLWLWWGCIYSGSIYSTPVQAWDRYRHVQAVKTCTCTDMFPDRKQTPPVLHCDWSVWWQVCMPHIPLHIQRHYKLTPTIWSVCEVVTMPSITFLRLALPHFRHSKVFESTGSGQESGAFYLKQQKNITSNSDRDTTKDATQQYNEIDTILKRNNNLEWC